MFESMEIMPDSWVENKFQSEALAAQIKILGVGGGGGNAVETMYNFDQEDYKWVQKKCGFFICNTDKQALENTKVPNKILIGDGLGAGCDQVEARDKAVQDIGKFDDVLNFQNTKVLFVAAGMGGGTGTGASPIIAKKAKDAGILTIAVVTMPFDHEGAQKSSAAVDGVLILKDFVDCLILVDNNKLYGEAYAQELFPKAFPLIDRVLTTAVFGLAQIITRGGKINVDLKDARNLLTDGGLTIVGVGSASGKNRIEEVVDKAFNTSLLLDLSAQTATDLLYNLTIPMGEKSITMEDHRKICNLIQEKAGNANVLKEGIVYDYSEQREDVIDLTIIATGIDMSHLDNLIDTQKTSFIDIDEDYVFKPQDILKEKNASKNSKKRKKTNNTISSTSAALIGKGPVFHIGKKPVLLAGDPKELNKQPAYKRKDHE